MIVHIILTLEVYLLHCFFEHGAVHAAHLVAHAGLAAAQHAVHVGERVCEGVGGIANEVQSWHLPVAV